jgi:hypothetical protein
MRSTYCLSANPVEAHKSLAGKVWQHIKALTVAGHRVDVTVQPAKRSNSQNSKLHAMMGEIAAQKEWAGAKRDSETWKRLMVAAWCRATGDPVEFLPALDGKGVDIVFRRTSDMTRAEVSELIEFVACWGAEHGVVFRDDVIDPETGEILSSQRPCRSSDGD